MMAALFSAVSGLKSQQSSLDVISNNISNVNTTGYKSQRVSFGDLLSQTISAASSSTATTGGTNAVQLGMGVSVGSIDTIMTAGTSQSTGVATDVSIGGNGFFVVQGGSQGEYQYTRDGNLSTDDAGNLTINGNKVCGWEQYTVDADGNYVYNTDTKAEAINVDSDTYNGSKKIMAAQATDSADFSGALNSSATASGTALNNIGTVPTTFDQTSTITVYDAQGNASDATISLKKCYVDATTNTTSWYWQASSDDATLGTPSSGYIEFDSNGKIITNASDITSLSAAIDTTTTNTTGYANSNVSIGTGVTEGNYTVEVADSSTTSGSYDITLSDGTNTYSATSTDGTATFTTSSGIITLSAPTALAVGNTAFTVSSYTTSFDTAPTLSVTSTAGATATANIALNFTDLSTSASSSTSTIATIVNGYASGDRESIAISADGTIIGTYSNGKTQSIGKIALAVFNNAEGLEKIGSNLYAASTNSGSATVVAAGSGGSGSLTSGTLEMSNVDLAAQFSEMMIAQRAYQANSKVISTADEMLQSLINMK